ncbi:MAG TPA: hypothetical protein VLD85_06335 [Anaeromyxobacteraceae bacterium]|nr:hypothetical protein [Anaeromyxobacteraceae bacterium]
MRLFHVLTLASLLSAPALALPASAAGATGSPCSCHCTASSGAAPAKAGAQAPKAEQAVDWAKHFQNTMESR